MILYKYVPAERIDILENESIRYTQPRLLNDPFEMTPHFGALLSSNEIIGVLNLWQWAYGYSCSSAAP